MEIYTDGSCRGNPGRGGWAAVIVDFRADNNPIASTSGPVRTDTTNNRMELRAAIEGLNKFLNLNGQLPEPPEEVSVVTDSMYMVNGMTIWRQEWEEREYQKVKNADLWEQLNAAADTIAGLGYFLTWKWVKAHSNDQYNEVVNLMAWTASKAACLEDSSDDVKGDGV